MLPVLLGSLLGTAVGNQFNPSIYDTMLSLRGLPILPDISAKYVRGVGAFGGGAGMRGFPSVPVLASVGVFRYLGFLCVCRSGTRGRGYVGMLTALRVRHTRWHKKMARDIMHKTGIYLTSNLTYNDIVNALYQSNEDEHHVIPVVNNLGTWEAVCLWQGM